MQEQEAEASPRQQLPALLYLLHPCSRKAPTVGAPAPASLQYMNG